VSDSLDDRPGFDRLRRDANAGKFDVVPFTRVDRFVRNLVVLYDIVQLRSFI